jgi:hypothetical protein
MHSHLEGYQERLWKNIWTEEKFTETSHLVDENCSIVTELRLIVFVFAM